MSTKDVFPTPTVFAMNVNLVKYVTIKLIIDALVDILLYIMVSGSKGYKITIHYRRSITNSEMLA